MKKYLLLLFILLFLLLTIISSTAKALGPADIHSSGGGGTDIVYVSILNDSKVSNPVELIVCARTLLIPYCYSSVGDIGYSIDGGYIHNMVDIINQTITPENGCDDAIVWVHATLPALSEGSHNVTAYFGRQHTNTYDVLAYKTVTFSITSEASNATLPSPSIPEFPITITLVTLLAAVSLLLIIGKRRHTTGLMH